MLKTILYIVVILHGMVHAWYILLLAKVVKYLPEIGWTGGSWLFPGSPDNPSVRTTAILLYGLAGLMFVISGIGLLSGISWNRSLLVVSAILSSLLLLVFFDGRWEMLVQKGLIGLIINIIILTVIIMTK